MLQSLCHENVSTGKSLPGRLDVSKVKERKRENIEEGTRKWKGRELQGETKSW
jgi:hypothetical protein